MSEVLQMADELDSLCDPYDSAIATELRRLHAEHTELGQALKRAIERINELEALNAELAKALRETTGAHELGVLLSVHGLDKARAALAKVGASK